MREWKRIVKEEGRRKIFCSGEKSERGCAALAREEEEIPTPSTV